ncbi:STAS domain-containing protein [Amycolatopsis sp. cmx-4-83]|uniref:STAS domain-containing protein n=1 Tax=Amycolatopsis sp. cmx-4-83 TaxID=2790940 RepID=UPI00397B3DB1
MVDGSAAPAWTITVSRTDPAAVEILMSGVLGAPAYSLMRHTLRGASVAARAPGPGAIRVDLTATTRCDQVLAEELGQLALRCLDGPIRLRVDVPPHLLSKLGTTDLVRFLHLADPAVTGTLLVDVEATWIDKVTLVIAVTGELDLAGTPRMRDEVALILAGRPLRLVLDLNGVCFLASTGVNEIVRLAHAATEDAVTLHVAAGPDNRRMLTMLGLTDTLLRVFDTRADALAAFGS